MLQMRDVGSPSSDYRWRHNDGDIIESWDNPLNVSILNVTVESEGIYACFASGHEHEQLHGIMRLIVRGSFQLNVQAFRWPIASDSPQPGMYPQQ